MTCSVHYFRPFVFTLFMAAAANSSQHEIESAQDKRSEAKEVRSTVRSERPAVKVDTASSDLEQRLREGTHISDAIGEFQKSSDRYAFIQQDGKRALRVLENLALERVVRVLEDDPSPRAWSVSGTITEYRGENFLLLTRAVLKPRTTPAPRKVDNKSKGGKPESPELKPEA